MSDGEHPAHATRVRWGLVATFYAIALLIAVATTALVMVVGGGLVGNQAATMLVAVFYMPAPLVAGLVVETIAGRRKLIRSVFRDFGPRIRRVLLLAVGVWITGLVVMVGGNALLGNLVHVPGVGALVTDQASFLTAITAILPPGAQLTAAQLAQMPPWWIIYVEVFIGSLTAGLTINGLFAFGEEYGWRGVLQDELAPLGSSKANVLIGLMWGFWHAPLIIATGYNFPGQPVLGTLMMMAALVPFAFIQYHARRITGSLLGPSVVHGIFNAFAGIALVSIGRDALIGYPLGLAGFVTLTVLALAISRVRVRPLGLVGSSAYPQDREAQAA